jgi:hypothetical protein
MAESIIKNRHKLQINLRPGLAGQVSELIRKLLFNAINSL